ncbi:hypothetical protein FIV42_14125 [Persicimonas caeni]|uniref:Uncharacterized protein n=1 Tax=Persicimonas caeni TaxID=2292766 RepID=A0A4Y6PU66_PERCE|nr:hypothetical protein [Persicimonas caeni]QDG51838.1 hypothetical protein FIV42_14125 [Persicimonas caeni]QED33059.1 hypothetical protein FRD00_14120 [Persicimonas caeni]
MLWTACEADKTQPATTADAASTCPGATAEEAAQQYHPRILRGRVLAPGGQLAMRSPFGDWLVGSAHAAPLEGEQTVPEATVALYRVGPDGQKRGEVLRRATTDIQGEWCMKLPDGVDFGPDVMLAASADDTRLRRSLVSPVATDIYSTTEALTRLLQEREVDFTKMPKETYLNIESIADTTVDLLQPVQLAPDDNVASTVDKIGEALAKDERLDKKIASLPKRGE